MKIFLIEFIVDEKINREREILNSIISAVKIKNSSAVQD